MVSPHSTLVDIQTENAHLRRRVAELEQQMDIYTSVLLHLPLGLQVYRLEDPDNDHTLRMLAATPAAAAMTGATLETMIGKTLDETFPALRAQGIPQAYAQVICSGEPIDIEVVYGDERTLERAFAVHAVPLPHHSVAILFNPGTQHKQTEQALRQHQILLQDIGSFDDITKSRHMEEELHKQIQLFENLIHTLPFPIFYKDADGVYIGCNRAFAEDVIGKSVSDIIGRNLSDLFPSETAAFYHTVDQELFQRGGTQVYERDLTYADGTLHTVLYYKSLFPRPDGTAGGIIGAMVDITQRKQAEEERDQLFTLSPDLICIAGFDGYFKRLNPSWQRVLGFTDAELYAEPFLSFVHKDDRQATIDAAQNLADGQAAIAFTNRYRCKDGSYRWIEWVSSPVPEQQRIYAVARDITARKQSEKALLMSQFALDHARDGVEWINLAGQFLYVNETSCKRLGYTRDELLTMRISDIVPTLSLEYWTALWDQEKQIGSLTVEIVQRRKDGSLFPVEVSATYLNLDDQEFVFAFTRDITERKRVEDDLQTFKSLVDSVPDGVGIGSFEGRVLYANRAFQEMTGYGEATIGIHMADIQAPQEHVRIPGIMQELVAHGSWQGVIWHRHKDQHIFPVYMSVTVLRKSDGTPWAHAAIMRDITEQQQQEAERALLQQQIIEAQQHAIRELSTPLLPLADHVLVLPLIGTLDSTRSTQVMETLLHGVATHRATVVIIDITGVKAVDTQVAQSIIRTARAVRLLGAQVVLTGIQPQIAQTLVQLGVELCGLVTRSTLQEGIAYALHTRRPEWQGMRDKGGRQ